MNKIARDTKSGLWVVSGVYQSVNSLGGCRKFARAVRRACRYTPTICITITISRWMDADV